MLLNLDERITNHFKLFIKICNKIEDFSILIDLLNEFALNEISSKKILALSKMCHETENDVQFALQSILKIMEEASYLNLKEDDLRDTLKIMGLSSEVISSLLFGYKDIQVHFTNLNANKHINERSYVNLKWRIDIQLSSKFVGDNAQPIIYLHLITLNPSTGKEETKILQTNPCNIRHLISELEMAQKEVESVYCQRVVKYIK